MRVWIRTYLIAAFIFVAALPLVIFWSWPYARILEVEKAAVHDRHLVVAQKLGFVLWRYHRDLVATLTAFHQQFGTGQGEEARALFRNLSFRHICVADFETGIVRASFLAEESPCPDRLPVGRMDLFHKLAAQDGPGVSPVVRPKGEAARLYLAMRSGDDLVVAAVHTGFFDQLRRQVAFGRDGHAVILDQQGGVLSHPCSDNGNCGSDITKLAPVRRVMSGETGVEVFYSPIKRKQMIAAFAPVPGVGWGVMVPQPLSELEEIAARFDREAFTVLSVGLGVSLIMALVVAFQLSNRLGKITSAVHEVTRENDWANVEPTSDLIHVRELQDLEADVNQLARRSAESRRARAEYSQGLEDANQMLRQEMNERQQAEAGRIASERRFRTLFENAPIPLREEDLSGIKAMVDETGITDPAVFEAYLDANPGFLRECGGRIVVVDANRAALALHGYASKQALLDGVLRTLTPTSMRIVRRTAMAIHAGGPGLSYETTIERLDGESRVVAARWSVMPGHEETYARILLSSVDITDRLESEAALRQAQKMEAVGQLTGGVAHDFNNLLTVIGGNAELLEATAELDRELTSPIIKAVRRGADLTQRLLAFSRKQPLAPRALDLGALVAGMSTLLQRSLGEEIVVEIVNDNPGWLALADPGQVEAALLNMALNSRDAMPDGGRLTISIAQATQGAGSGDALAPGDYVVLSVSDTGEGMSPDTLERAFEPFFTTKEVGKGSGLGLSMVYGFARQSGGDVSIDSTRGRGTTVSLSLPRTSLERDTPENTEPARVTASHATGDGQRVLVLEDDIEVRTFLVTYLERLGYVCIPAEDAAAAQALIDTGAPFDLLISDVVLPGGVLGPEFARAFLARHPDTPVLFISGRQLSDDPLPASAPLLSKPFDGQQLERMLQALLHGV